ncbi:bifunctional DNA-formamidopyrimidine glycosylase/DNA-(apurinic or apyrimidinic site) lyase [Candidatus Saccharibacteria bacterium]|nr:bifunctional DNA-formamidopyrimidine glycosylase/DNA-(apurinic or apyrimidinic site) lyase [Candidatus Saccharibacteria bacterium]
MPELPEVETIRRGLDRIIVKQKIKNFKVFNDKSFIDEVDQKIIGLKVLAVRRRAKLLIIDLEQGLSLAIHLKMTGQIIFRPLKRSATGSLVANENHAFHERLQPTNYGFAGGHPTKSMERELPDKSTRVEIDLENGKLFYGDERKFGWVRLMKTDEVGDLPFLQKAGPDFNDPNLKFKTFKERIKRHPKMKIKAALLDQTIAAGLGNIYADETLALSRIHPLRLVSDLSDKELKTIFDSAREILAKAISLHGSSWRNYRDANGDRGSYLDNALVYGRAGEPCPFCGGTLEKIKVAGRGTVLCPKCQRL